jgi:DNA-binding NarL/FixJ family response regulator
MIERRDWFLKMSENAPPQASGLARGDSIRLLLAEAHPLLRAGLDATLRGMKGIEIVAESGDGAEVLSLVKLHHPNIALLDTALPTVSGLEMTSQLAAAYPEVRVIVLSMYLEEQYVREAVKAGAAGYLLKDALASEIELAIRAVALGQSYLSPAVIGPVMAVYRQVARGERQSLSPRQTEVLRLIAEGHNTRAIARTLGVTPKTVETHRSQVMERLGISEVASLVRYAIRIGLVRPDA